MQALRDRRFGPGRLPTDHAPRHFHQGVDPLPPKAIGAATQTTVDAVSARVTVVETAYVDATDITDAITAHEAASDPHSQYTTAAEATTIADAAVAAHVALADPHTQYQKESEKGAAGGYASLDGSAVLPLAQLPAHEHFAAEIEVDGGAFGGLLQSLGDPTDVQAVCDFLDDMVGGGLEVSGTTIRRQALTGHVAASAGSNSTTIQTGVVTLAMWASGVLDTDATLAANSASKVPSQSAVKSYVDGLITGLKWKASVACATTGNITLSGEQTIDGVTTSSSRVMVKDQSTASQNGLYVSSSGAWTRSTDADTGTELADATCFVEAGTVNGNTQWTVTTDTIVLGVTSVAFAQVSGAGTYSATGGITLSGNQFSITTAGITYAMFQDVAKLSVVGRSTGTSGVSAAITATSGTDAVLGESGGTIDWGTVATAGLANDCVTFAKLQNSAAGISVIGKAATGAGDFAEIVASANGQALVRHAGSLVFAQIDLTADVTGVLPLANGGTNSTTFTGALDTAKVIRLLTSTLGSTEVNTSNAEGTLIDYTVTGGTMGANGGLLVEIWGTILNNRGGNTIYTPRVYWGGTKYWGSQTTIGSAATYHVWTMRFVINNLASASSQAISGRCSFSSATAGTDIGVGAFGGESAAALFGAGNTYPAKNTASDQNVKVTMQMDTSDANSRYKVDGIRVWLIAG